MTTIQTVKQRLAALEERVARIEAARSSPRTAHADLGKKKIAAREFLLTKQLKTETQKTLVLGYYLEHVQSVSPFNIEDLVTVFQSAKEKRPQNMNDAVNKNVARGLLMETAEKKGSKKAWVLTSTGEKYVEEELKK